MRMVRVILLLALVELVILVSCIKVSGDLSHKEERNEVLKKDRDRRD